MLATLCNYSGNAKTVMVIDLIVSSDRPILLPERRWDSPKKIALYLTLQFHCMVRSGFSWCRGFWTILLLLLQFSEEDALLSKGRSKERRPSFYCECAPKWPSWTPLSMTGQDWTEELCFKGFVQFWWPRPQNRDNFFKTQIVILVLVVFLPSLWYTLISHALLVFCFSSWGFLGTRHDKLWIPWNLAHPPVLVLILQSW